VGPLSVIQVALCAHAAEPRLPSVAAGALHPIPCHKRNSLFSSESPSTNRLKSSRIFSIDRGSLCSVGPPSIIQVALHAHAAEPRIPSVTVGAPHPIHRCKGDSPFCSESPSTTRFEPFLAFPASDRAPPSGAAEPRLPSIAVGALHPIRRRKGDSPSR
ncbi:hypothetical protein M9458_055782, partial [Cirrhinus mrigala]